jgi:NhaA family Na+:H+ antiporter
LLSPNLKKTLLAKQALIHFKKFLNIEADSSIFIFIFAAIALMLANSGFTENYHDILHKVLSVNIFEFKFSFSLHFFINEVLMTLFFLAVGLEINYEINNGNLSNTQQALLPIIAAIGGVIAPALIFILLSDNSLLLSGWAIPTATDIAFAVGALSLLKRHIPSNLRVFLLTLAIIDDIIAIAIIAIFYSESINFNGFIIALLGIAFIHLIKVKRVYNIYVYIFAGIIIWCSLFIANIHPTLTGVIVGLLIPQGNNNASNSIANVSFREHIQKKLHPWVSYMIMPLFALANAGIAIKDVNFYDTNSQTLILSIILALVIGKPLGIVSASMIFVKLKLCKLPQNINWPHILLIGLLAGIGFTMSIFIALLSFSASNDLLNASKFAVLIGSIIASIFGVTWGIILAKTQKKIC